jgi:hypothetical protein
MALGQFWAGGVAGTNTGKAFVKFEGNDAALTGSLHFNDTDLGIVVYSLTGSFDGKQLTFAGKPQIEGEQYAPLTATATLNAKGNLEGQWQTDQGTAGVFLLFPQQQGQTAELAVEAPPEQLHTGRHQFGAIQVDRDQITSLAEDIQREFKNAKIVVTVVAGTEQSRFLPDFRALVLNEDRATNLKLFASEPEGTGVNRVISVEFGPQINSAMTQGADEAWVLGMLERLKRSLKPFERSYATNIKRIGLGFTQMLLLAAIVYLPSLASLSDRAIFMIGVLVIILGVNWLHSRYLPMAAIYLRKRPQGFLSRAAPSVLSWLIALTAGAAATLLAGYLQGWIGKEPASQVQQTQ